MCQIIRLTMEDKMSKPKKPRRRKTSKKPTTTSPVEIEKEEEPLLYLEDLSPEQLVEFKIMLHESIRDSLKAYRRLTIDQVESAITLLAYSKSLRTFKR
jgi:hypothetical protein